jgi:hypothetical protein
MKALLEIRALAVSAIAGAILGAVYNWMVRPATQVR